MHAPFFLPSLLYFQQKKQRKVPERYPHYKKCKKTTYPLTVPFHPDNKKTTMKNIFLISMAVLGLMTAHSQTNVSGGIFSDTTWTLANSPYIVTDTVVVFPTITLTIQAGVTVKFDTLTQLEIRQAKLIAVGTQTDSI